MSRSRKGVEQPFSFSDLDIVVYECRFSEGHMSICDIEQHFLSISQSPTRIKLTRQDKDKEEEQAYPVSESSSSSTTSGSLSDSSMNSVLLFNDSRRSNLSERVSLRLKGLTPISTE
jgi:hypothetical protein